ncbi:MAG: hypothetical protein PVH18_07465 [Chloroflexota bacterium]
MNQLQAQNYDFWASEFSVSESDIEQLYNHFLEVGLPQTAADLARVLIAHRVAEESNRIKQLLSGRTVYQPQNDVEVGEELVFPGLKYAFGTVASTRQGYDPRYGHYDVAGVEIAGRTREFASNLPGEHKLNLPEGEEFDPFVDVDVEDLYERFGDMVAKITVRALKQRNEFVELSDKWFVRGLMAEVNIGHLHLAEAILEVNEGGPLPTGEIMVHLDMDPGLAEEVRLFSLDHALLGDDRFDEVGVPGEVQWFLRRLEPDQVRVVPERLRYSPMSFDRALLSPQLLLLERELDDEWSDLTPETEAQPTILSLTYPHRWAGTLPLSARTRPLFPTGTSPRQRIIIVDESNDDEIVAWVVKEHRYVYGLKEWYRDNQLPVGGFITLKPGPEPGIVLIDFDRRRSKKEWVRLASVVDNQIDFELERRSVGCGYDDLLIVGTDYVTAVDALARRFEANHRSLGSLLANFFPKLAKLNPQETVHTKTLYSAINMVRRLPPGPLFAELIKNPSFQPVGDHYWQMR